MLKKDKEKTLVAIVWDIDLADDTLRTLQYGDGSTRVYEKDKYDGRLGPDIPYCGTGDALLEAVKKDPKAMVQLDISLAYALGIM